MNKEVRSKKVSLNNYPFSIVYPAFLQGAVVQCQLKLMLLGILLLLTVNTYAANDKTAIKKLFTRFQSGWNSKNYDKVNSCLHNPGEKQDKAYEIINQFVDSVKVNVKVEDIQVSLPYAKVTVKIKRHFILKGKKEDRSVIKKEIDGQEETLNYVVFKDGRHWKILGILDKATVTADKLGPKPITSSEADDFLKEVRKAEKEGKKKEVKEAVELKSEGKMISWHKMPRTLYYNIQLSESNPLQSHGGALLEKKNLEFAFFSIPVETYEKMQENKNYFLLVEGYNSQNEKTGMYLLKVKREN